MTFEYHVIQRTTRHTSGHEVEELGDILNLKGSEGWRLHTIVPQEKSIELVIFEREKSGK
mgnify:CR=1 FL=1